MMNDGHHNCANEFYCSGSVNENAICPQVSVLVKGRLCGSFFMIEMERSCLDG